MITAEKMDELIDWFLKTVGPNGDCGEVVVRHDGTVVETKISHEEFVRGIMEDRVKLNGRSD